MGDRAAMCLRGSNPRPMAHKTIALTTELREHAVLGMPRLVRDLRLRFAILVLRSRCNTAFAPPACATAALSSGMILGLGPGGPGFNSRSSPCAEARAVFEAHAVLRLTAPRTGTPPRPVFCAWLTVARANLSMLTVAFVAWPSLRHNSIHRKRQ